MRKHPKHLNRYTRRINGLSMTTRKIGIHLPAELVNTVARRMGLSNKGAEDEICMMLLANSTNIGWNEEFQLFGTIEDSTYESEGLDQPLVKLQ